MAENQIILTKETSEGDLRQYFEAVLRLAEQNEEFPVNLDEVWPLVYSKKRAAVKSLKQNFVEGVDYQVLHRIMQNPKGGHPLDEYRLSTSCLEYFIARKVRPVFEVYRQVFHRVAQSAQPVIVAPKTMKEALLLALQQQEQIEQQQALLEEKQALLEQKEETIELQTGELKKSAPKVNYYDRTLQSRDTLTISEIGNELGMGGKELNRRLSEAGIIYKRDPASKLWLLKKPYSGWNLAQTRTQTYMRSDGSIGTKHLTVYNERGRRFIIALSQCNYDPKAAVALIQGKH